MSPGPCWSLRISARALMKTCLLPSTSSPPRFQVGHKGGDSWALGGERRRQRWEGEGTGWAERVTRPAPSGSRADCSAPPRGGRLPPRPQPKAHPQSQGGLPAAPALSPARKKEPYVDLLVRCFHLERANALVLPAGGPRPRSPPPVFQRQRFLLVPGDKPVDDEAQH